MDKTELKKMMTSIVEKEYSEDANAFNEKIDSLLDALSNKQEVEGDSGYIVFVKATYMAAMEANEAFGDEEVSATATLLSTDLKALDDTWYNQLVKHGVETEKAKSISKNYSFDFIGALGLE